MRNLFLLIAITGFQLVHSQYKVGFTVGVSQFGMNADFYESSSKITPEFLSHIRYIINDRAEILYDATLNFSRLQLEGKVLNEDNEVSAINRYTLKQTSMNLGVYYNYNVVPRTFSIFAGPTASWGFSPKIKEDTDSRIRFGPDNVEAEAIESFQGNLYATAGITGGIDNIRIRLKYSYGLLNPYRNSEYLDQETFETKALSAKTSFISLALMYAIDF